MTIKRTGPLARAFTLVELIVVIVVIAILSGVAIPKYFDYTTKAKSSAMHGTVDGVRSAIANFYFNQATNGTARYPTLQELQAVGTVMQETMPANPYNNDNTIVAANYPANPAQNAPPVAGNNGWNYDANSGKFWCNTATASANTY